MTDGYEYFDFAKNFRQCCEDSCDRVYYRMENDHPAIKQSYLRMEELEQQISKKLGAEEGLIEELAHLHCQINDQGTLLIYRQGFQDCVYLLHWLGMLKLEA